jgi:hypothetical protein
LLVASLAAAHNPNPHRPTAVTVAAADHSVTMTVDGVETPIAAGTFTGAIVLAVD